MPGFPAGGPTTVVLSRPGGPQSIDVPPPFHGVIWDTHDLRGLKGPFRLVDGGVTEALLEYSDGSWKWFGIQNGDYGVIWGYDDNDLGDNHLIAVDQRHDPFDHHLEDPGVLIPPGCKLVDGQVWCPP